VAVLRKIICTMCTVSAYDVMYVFVDFQKLLENSMTIYMMD